MPPDAFCLHASHSFQSSMRAVGATCCCCYFDCCLSLLLPKEGSRVLWWSGHRKDHDNVGAALRLFGNTNVREHSPQSLRCYWQLLNVTRADMYVMGCFTELWQLFTEDSYECGHQQCQLGSPSVRVADLPEELEGYLYVCLCAAQNSLTGHHCCYCNV